jgi:hypothetical protein
MPVRRDRGIITHTTTRGLTVSGYDELNNRQLVTIRNASTTIEVGTDGSPRTTFHPILMPFMITVEWMSHSHSNWDLVNQRGKRIDNTVKTNVENEMDPDDFDEVSDWLFEQFGYRVMDVSEDMVEEIQAEREAAIAEERGIVAPEARPHIARAEGEGSDDEDDDAQNLDDGQGGEGDLGRLSADPNGTETTRTTGGATTRKSA